MKMFKKLFVKKNEVVALAPVTKEYAFNYVK